MLAPIRRNLPGTVARIQGPYTDIDRVRQDSVKDYFSYPAAVEQSTSPENVPPPHHDFESATSIYLGFPTLATMPTDPQAPWLTYPAAVELSSRGNLLPASIYDGFPTLVVVPSPPRSAQSLLEQHGPLLSNYDQQYRPQDDLEARFWHTQADFLPSRPADASIPSSSAMQARQHAPPIVLPSSSPTASALPPSGPFPSPEGGSPPPDRSAWAMWVGNVPRDATYEELWDFFLCQERKRSRKGKAAVSPLSPTTKTLQEVPNAAGVLSIFLILQSSCAFVNYDSPPHLFAALERFDGAMLRPDNRKCRPLVCRARRPQDGARRGSVLGQHGTNMHARWIKERHGHDMVITDDVLRWFFPQRYFLLKSRTLNNLDLSTETGLWATQQHNEGVLNEAFRTSRDVYLVFSVNKSGEFYGFARMAGPIGEGAQAHAPVSWTRKVSNPSASSTAALRLNPSPDQDLVASPETTPHARRSPDISPASPTVDQADRLFSRMNLAESEGAPTRGEHPTSTAQLDEDALARAQGSAEDADADDDTSLSDRSGWGTEFAVTWLRVDGLSFTHTRGLKNKWNYNRDVKISRDGTELEPNVGKALVDLWSGQAVA
ncbi:hypothetical protein HMN09_01079200 [Mycena chlorophos]|uniref:YTH domain-containing protein n=1 Tax=Mycena chlorophos TaxID=658473 RepID=A0A8H6VYP5_MYCCL|nr:hypothetical protein HMN09_01079200 [Mycena chlorophos]